jgi:hypothetical protein
MNKQALIQIFESDIPEQFKENIAMGIEELLDLIGKYKAKRNLWEVKLRDNHDPSRPEFYAILARLSVFDMMVADLQCLNGLLAEI